MFWLSCLITDSPRTRLLYKHPLGTKFALFATYSNVFVFVLSFSRTEPIRLLRLLSKRRQDQFREIERARTQLNICRHGTTARAECNAKVRGKHTISNWGIVPPDTGLVSWSYVSRPEAMPLALQLLGYNLRVQTISEDSMLLLALMTLLRVDLRTLSSSILYHSSPQT